MATSGIPVSPDLLETFQKGECSWLKVVITEEGDMIHMNLSASGSEDAAPTSFASAAASIDGSPCYLLISVKEDGDEESKWVLGLFVPPVCKPRAKMLYSSSLAGLQKSLQISPVTTLQGSDADDFAHSAYLGRMDLSGTAAASMTEDEKAAQVAAREDALAKAASMGSGGAEAAFATKGFGFPLHEEAIAALQRFAQDTSVVAVLLQVAREEEIIVLNSLRDTGAVTEGLLEAGDEEPIFSFVRVDAHTFFVYICPATCKVKRKMVYSSARNGLLAAAEGQCGLKPEYRQEVGSVAEVTEEWLRSLFAPVVEEAPQVMTRPGGKPRSRPPRRAAQAQ